MTKIYQTKFQQLDQWVVSCGFMIISIWNDAKKKKWKYDAIIMINNKSKPFFETRSPDSQTETTVSMSAA